jgi:hypothetical protein
MSLTTVAVNMGGTGAQTPANAQTNLQNLSFKNRIINGAMTISQYNGTSSSTPIGDGFFIDRYRTVFTGSSKFTVGQNLNSVTPPTGFPNYLGLQVATAGSIGASDINAFAQYIEGVNVFDLAWGTANAKTVTLSFLVYSNITGTFGGALQNSAQNRSYPFTYTISSTNTWTTVSVTIAGDTSGTWLTTTGVGLRVFWSLGTGSTFSGTAGAWAGSNFYSATGATTIMASTSNVFYITGVQLEVGSTATTFDYRPYGTELALCQRYFQAFIINTYSYAGNTFATNDARTSIPLLVSMRTAPTGMTIVGSVFFSSATGSNIGVPTFNHATINQITMLSSASGYAAAGGSTTIAGGGTIQVSAEL